MICPECGAQCDRDEVDVGVGVISGPWGCYECGWDEDNGFPMVGESWDKWLSEGPKPDAYND